MDPNPYAAPTSSLDTPTPGTVSMVRYGVLCFIALWVFILGYALVSRLTGVRIGQWAGILCLLASVQCSNGWFVRTHRRVMSPLEFKRFALACIAAFWIFDELPVLITRFSPDQRRCQRHRPLRLRRSRSPPRRIRCHRRADRRNRLARRYPGRHLAPERRHGLDLRSPHACHIK
jgi:hypothetical protein